MEAVSVVDSTYAITSKSAHNLSSPLVILVFRSWGSPSLGEEQEYWSQWFDFEYRRLKILINVFMLQHWLAWRRGAVREIDSESYNYELSHVDAASLPEMRNTEDNLEEIRRRWVETYSASADEHQRMLNILDRYLSGQADTPFDVL